MDRLQKEEFIADMQARFKASSLVVVTHYSGLTVAEVTGLRNQVREAGADFKVTKNRLTRLALKGTEFENITDLLTGPTGLAISADPVAAAKSAVEFAKSNDKLQVLGGCLNGEFLDVKQVKALASLPSLDELRGKIVGVLQAPAQKIAVVSGAPASQLARVFSAYGNSAA